MIQQVFRLTEDLANDGLNKNDGQAGPNIEALISEQGFDLGNNISLHCSKEDTGLDLVLKNGETELQIFQTFLTHAGDGAYVIVKADEENDLSIEFADISQRDDDKVVIPMNLGVDNEVDFSYETEVEALANQD
ncbi:MAG: hypothetical protein O3C63_04230 [Cyanobacteria bacterium]|nr:hypothetical protein [Cyanobacteriota bacterium]MDA1021339.1 hypothetical protein [Cyanobacteriota bacterium]